MVRRRFSRSALLFSLALVAASCANPSPAPTAPGIEIANAVAAVDGSTLKATAPPLVFPVGGVRLDTLQPELVAGAGAARFGPGAAFEYRFELQTMAGQVVANSVKLPAGANGQTRWKVPQPLELDTRYRWRARVEMGSNFGPWSPFAEFLSLDYRGIVPRPPNGAWPTTGPAVVDYIAKVFPQYLHPTALTATRLEHMEFLRDRIIEAGICGGLDVSRNLKRGVGPHSHDAIAWRKANGFVEVVDIASAFDDKTIHLELHWAIVSGPPGYDKYLNHPGC